MTSPNKRPAELDDEDRKPIAERIGNALTRAFRETLDDYKRKLDDDPRLLRGNGAPPPPPCDCPRCRTDPTT